MAKKVFENQDLVRLIYSFGSVEHRIHMYWVADSLCFPRFNRTDKQLGKQLLSPVPNLMKQSRDWRMYVNFFVYSRCRCCSRHSHRKPMIYLEEGMVVFRHGDNTMIPEARGEKDCPCECRHNCRIIMYQLTDRYD